MPKRRSYSMAVVAAVRIMSVARNADAALAPLFTGAILAAPPLGLPFLPADGIKIIYDLSIYRTLPGIKLPEENH